MKRTSISSRARGSDKIVPITVASALNRELSWSDDPDATARVIERLASVGVCISSLELLARRRQLTDTGLLSWRVSRLRQKWLVRGAVGQLLDLILAYPGVLGLICVRFGAGTALLLGQRSPRRRFAMTSAITLSSIGLTLRAPYGQDGSDQMSELTFAAATLGNLPFLEGNVTVKESALWFIGLQTCLSFLTAGIAKTSSPMWRDGSALMGIFGTEAYGNHRLADYLRSHPRQTACMSRGIVIGECLFPLVLVAPRPLAHAGLVGGLIFHALTAQVMGLNTFLWSFGATYPAIAYCNHRVRERIRS